MTIAAYSPEQIDALEEVANIAMGQAGASLATMLDLYVTLSVPRSRIVDAANVASTVASMTDDPSSITAVRQAFFHHLRGEAIVLFGPQGCSGMADLMGHEDSHGFAAEHELLLDVSNILVGAVLNGLGEQLETQFNFSAPAIMALHQPVLDLLDARGLGWSHALLIEVNFALEARDFKCHLVLLMPEESIELMRGVLDGMLARL